MVPTNIAINLVGCETSIEIALIGRRADKLPPRKAATRVLCAESNLELLGRINRPETTPGGSDDRERAASVGIRDFTANSRPESCGLRRHHGCGRKKCAGARSEPGRATHYYHQPAARFQSSRRPDDLFPGSRHHHGRFVVQ